MKNLLVVLLPLLVIVICSCQQKQFFEESPEIQLVKEANDAYLKRDWQKLRTFYADTATIFINTWDRNRLTPDEVIEIFKSSLADITEYSLSEDQVSQMVITNEGDHQVNMWFEWVGKHKNGKEIRSVVCLTCNVRDNKIVFSGLIYDTLPFYLAAQPDSVSTLAAQ